ncbi:MAG: hypothetical protein KQA41_03760, partial [Candidatus Aenigmarchaeota archaeon]|nr:hypothetical protein [Candidatus Aenigmarchaeota archaeon]
MECQICSGGSCISLTCNHNICSSGCNGKYRYTCCNQCVNHACSQTDCGNTGCSKSCGAQCEKDSDCGSNYKCSDCICVYVGGSSPPPPPQPSCTNVGLQQPIINPSTPIEGSSFQITCPANGQYNCIAAYANGAQNQCNFLSWSGNNAIFSCSPMPPGTYTARCTT